MKALLLGVMVLAGAAAPLDVADNHSRAAGPQGDPGQFFSDDAYPPEAIRSGEQGRVVAKLTIGSSGKVVGCDITVSSGFSSLDAATCSIALANVTFTPATDTAGRPIASTYTLPVKWVLPGNEEIEVTDPGFTSHGDVQVVLTIDPGGIVKTCNATGGPQADITAACTFFAPGRHTIYNWTRNGRPIGGKVILHNSRAFTLDP